MKRTLPNKATEPALRDYAQYEMTAADVFSAFVIGAAIAVVVGQIFFGNVIVDVIMAVGAGIIAQKIYRNVRIKQTKALLLLQFKDMLDVLSAAYSSGMVTATAFRDAETNMRIEYGVKGMICKELRRINYCSDIGESLEKALVDFGNRSHLEDVLSFANVLLISKESGGNIRFIVSEARNIINDKIDIEREIVTLISGAKQSLNIMIFMPLLVVPMASSFVEPGGGAETINMIVKIVGIGLFALAYFIGAKITDIKL